MGGGGLYRRLHQSGPCTYVRNVGQVVEGQVEPGQRLRLFNDVPRQGRQSPDVGQVIVVEPQ